MKTYLITLQLSQQESTYTNLSAYLKTAVSWAHPMNNTWIISTSKSVSDVRDGIKSRIHSGDKALVILVSVNFI